MIYLGVTYGEGEGRGVGDYKDRMARSGGKSRDWE